jgi:hypothetical protein
MATVTWLGSEGDDNMKETTWAGVTFKKGESVEVTDEYILGKASASRFFKVEGYDVPEAELIPAPSTVSAQYPVPKPGEPMPKTAVVTPLVTKPKYRKV